MQSAVDLDAPSNWPSSLWLVRHGQSAGNVALDAAEAAGLPTIEIAGRDVDVPLSELGERQASALGGWFAEMPVERQPNVVLSSPYVRALQTTERIVAAIDPRPELLVDERLREKEFGSLNRLTRAGIVAKFPQETELRRHLGKFYYRPPGGESWCDVILRLRSAIDQIQLQHSRQRVLIVAHQVVILGLRYVLERLTEAQILAIDRERDVANCGVTSYQYAPGPGPQGGMALLGYNFVAPLERAGEPVTKAPDVPVAPR
jgi:2,3-bisphosphoglycerate-dependent phosphoglycerate mutase